MEGKVKWFNTKNGYGFIEGEDGMDYFVHKSALKSIKFIRENDKVSFEAAEGEKGKYAKNVILLQKGSEMEGGEETQKEEPKEESKAEESEESSEEEQEENSEESSEEEQEENQT